MATNFKATARDAEVDTLHVTLTLYHLLRKNNNIGKERVYHQEGYIRLLSNAVRTWLYRLREGVLVC